MLTAAGEGVLPERLEHSVQLHLDWCRRCAMLRRDLTVSPLAEPTLEEITRVQQRVKASTHQSKRAAVRYAAFAACAAIVLMLPLAWEQEKPVRMLQEKTAERSIQTTTSITSKCRPTVTKAPLRLPLATAMVIRGARGAEEQRFLRELGQALAPYRADDFVKASAGLERLASRYPRRVEPVFYLGVARLMGGDAEAATEALESAKKIGSEELDEDIARYLSMAQRASTCNAAGQ
jgi:hypothetical protein